MCRCERWRPSSHTRTTTRWHSITTLQCWNWRSHWHSPALFIQCVCLPARMCSHPGCRAGWQAGGHSGREVSNVLNERRWSLRKVVRDWGERKEAVREGGEWAYIYTPFKSESYPRWLVLERVNLHSPTHTVSGSEKGRFLCEWCHPVPNYRREDVSKNNSEHMRRRSFRGAV